MIGLSYYRLAFAIACSVAMAGCAGDGPETGHVEGRVTFQGKPVSGGQVRLVTSQGAAVGEIQPDGTFTAHWKRSPEVPVGDYRVAITPPQPPSPDSADAALPPPDPRFPNLYRRAATSSLAVTVASGRNMLDLDMQ